MNRLSFINIAMRAQEKRWAQHTANAAQMSPLVARRLTQATANAAAVRRWQASLADTVQTAPRGDRRDRRGWELSRRRRAA